MAIYVVTTGSVYCNGTGLVASVRLMCLAIVTIFW